MGLEERASFFLFYVFSSYFFSNLFKKLFRIKNISYFLRVDLIEIISYNLGMGIGFNNKIGKIGGLRCC